VANVRKLLGALAVTAVAASTLAVGAAPAVAANPTVATPAITVQALPHDPHLGPQQIHQVQQMMGPCLCGSNFGMASIAPWDNPDCATHFRVGSTVAVNVTVLDATDWRQIGYMEWWYSPNGTCAKQQWKHYVLNMTLVHRYLGADAHFSDLTGIWDDTLHWANQYVGFTGGQSDGNFQGRAVKAGAARTWGAMTVYCCPITSNGDLMYNHLGGYAIAISA
jgi:hypothetical protein